MDRIKLREVSRSVSPQRQSDKTFFLTGMGGEDDRPVDEEAPKVCLLYYSFYLVSAPTCPSMLKRISSVF